MITCLGLIVGVVESPHTQDILNQCAKFVKKYPHLLKCGLEFVIDGLVYATVIDTHIDNGETLILCSMYDGFTRIGTSK